MLQIPELKELVNLSRRYLKGEINVIELNAVVTRCKALSIVLGLEPQIKNLLNEYSQKTEGAWNEWGLSKTPFSEDELKSWINDDFLDDNDWNYQTFKDNK